MKIAVLNETFSRKMGYLENSLPKYLARLGIETHVLTMDLPPYYQVRGFNQTYGRFVDADGLTPGESEQINGFSLHVLGHDRKLGFMRMIGMREKLRQLQPDIVQTTAAVGWIPLDAAIAVPSPSYKLFTGSHSTASTFALRANTSWFDRRRIEAFFLRTIPGRLISYRTEKCYAVTEDCAQIAIRFFGVPRPKVEVMYLGVDTDFFFPVSTSQMDDERAAVRSNLGYKENDIVCIYTGKFTETKNALILARAVERLVAAGYPYRALFVGSGVQQREIEACPTSKVLDFMDFQRLGPYYRAADIGVWPTNESTSSLDAAACGLPLVLSDGIVYRAHVEGNGLIYRMNDLSDLMRVLLELQERAKRARLGVVGAEKMKYNFSWLSVAQRRIRDYEMSLGSQASTLEC